MGRRAIAGDFEPRAVRLRETLLAAGIVRPDCGVLEQGFLQAIYDSGFRRTLYQIPVGDVPNMNGLRALDSQSYSISASSGNLYFWDAATGPVGGISGYSLMEYNFSSELTPFAAASTRGNAIEVWRRSVKIILRSGMTH